MSETTTKTQEDWEGKTPEERQSALAETVEEAPVTDNASPPAEEPKEEVQEEVQKESPEEITEKPLILGKFKTQDDVVEGYTQLERKVSEQAEQLAKIRKESPAPDPYADIKPADPFDQSDVTRHAREMAEVSKTEAVNATREQIREYEAGRPIRQMIEKFGDDHPDLTAAHKVAVASYADAMAREGGRAVTLDEAFENMSSTMGQKSTPKETQAIKAAQKVPDTLSEAPAANPPSQKSRMSTTQAQWQLLSQEEKNNRMMDIGTPPDGS